jgi:hypothetical protein
LRSPTILSVRPLTPILQAMLRSPDGRRGVRHGETGARRRQGAEAKLARLFPTAARHPLPVQQRTVATLSSPGACLPVMADSHLGKLPSSDPRSPRRLRLRRPVGTALPPPAFFSPEPDGIPTLSKFNPRPSPDPTRTSVLLPPQTLKISQPTWLWCLAVRLHATRRTRSATPLEWILDTEVVSGLS